MGKQEKKLHFDMAAELEADEIGQKFQNSTDVVGDMSRAYGVDLSGVSIHTDSAAADMVAQRGVDAFSTGTDVFFGRGIFNAGNADSRRLLGHELAHSMQQGVGGGMGAVQQSAPLGAEQGGWLGNLFRRKKKKTPETPQTPEIKYQELGMSKDTSPEALKYMTEMKVMEGYLKKMQTKEADVNPEKNANGQYMLNGRDYMSFDSYLLGDYLSGLSEAEMNTEAMRGVVVDDFNKNMNARLLERQGQIKEGDDQFVSLSPSFRGKAGELYSLNQITGAAVGRDFYKQVREYGKPGKIEKISREDFSQRPNNYSAGGAFDYMGSEMVKNDALMGVLTNLGPAFEGVESMKDEGVQSDLLMSNFVLRNVTDKISTDYNEEKKEVLAAIKAKDIKKIRANVAKLNAEHEKKTGKKGALTEAKELDYQADLKMYREGREYQKLASNMMKGMAQGARERAKGEGTSAAKFSGLLAPFLKKKRKQG